MVDLLEPVLLIPVSSSALRTCVAVREGVSEPGNHFVDCS